MQRLKNLFGGKKKGEERNNNTHNHGHHSHSHHHSHKKNHGESKKVFGVPLDPSSLIVPPIVQKMVNHLKTTGM